ncbi:hypothetical protein [uncultured Kordia sp.]|uniref:hypothetical protein n=1 Tax=uncultured Kordia sp. TaxID=507699 RepID=UPI0026257935|nr:hypothetical protein [uncultured Kordia sp.]
MSTNSETTASQNLSSYAMESTGDNRTDAQSIQGIMNTQLDNIVIDELLHVAICADISGTIWNAAVTYKEGNDNSDSSSTKTEYEVAVAIDTNTSDVCNTLNSLIRTEQDDDNLVPVLINWSYSSTGVVLAMVGLAPTSDDSGTYEVLVTTNFEQSVQQIESDGGTIIDSCVYAYGMQIDTLILYKSGS